MNNSKLLTINDLKNMEYNHYIPEGKKLETVRNIIHKLEMYKAVGKTFAKHKATPESVLKLLAYFTKKTFDSAFADPINTLAYFLDISTLRETDKHNNQLAAEMLSILWKYTWAKEGFPIVRLSKKQTASMAISNTSTNNIGDPIIQLPWRGFVIQLPDNTPILTKRVMLGLVTSNETINKAFIPPEEQTRNKVATEYQALVTIIEGADGRYNFKVTGNPQQLVNHLAYPTSNRYIDLTCTLLINTLVALNQKSETQEIKQKNTKKKKKNKKKNKLKHKLKIKEDIPESKEYILTTPVTIDHSQYVHEYVLGKTNRKYKAKWIVRGHWRHQACGPNRSQRRMKYIEPYIKNKTAKVMIIKDYKIKGYENDN